MRGNGLSAAAYVAVADLDPQTADALLDALRDRGVAAYAAASPDPDPAGQESDVDRLYVDVAAVEEARALIAAGLSAAELSEVLGPDDSPHDDSEAADAAGLDFDAEFAAIVAGFHDASAPRTWPEGEDLAARPEPPAPPGPPSQPRPYTGWDDLLRPAPPADAVPEPDAEERYVPPPPPPLPRGDPRTWAAWVAVLGGPLVLFTAVLLGWQLDDWVMLLAAVSFLVGFVALVARLGDRPDDEDDDGAVV